MDDNDEMKLYCLEESWESSMCVFAKSPSKAMELLIDKYDYALLSRSEFVVYDIPKDDERVMDKSDSTDLMTCDTSDPFLLELRSSGIKEWIERVLKCRYGG